ncbi:MAG: sigma-54 dependent transcriptional regulator [Bacteroidia bacterium]|nr:sigma-54 dependent transcriptional regulator [Bacteroidia bacterium]
MKEDGHILIIDDNEDLLKSMVQLLKNEFKKIDTLKNPNIIPEYLINNNPDVILLDMNFSAGQQTGNEGIFWLREILKTNRSAIVYLITAFGDTELAVKAIKEGGTDFIVKPWDPAKLIVSLKAGIKLRRSQTQLEKLESTKCFLLNDLDNQYDPLLGSSPAMKRIYDIINKVAATDANVLITGENGTGKELVAREIHRKSERADMIFIHVDLGSITTTLFESELFGYIKGAFTDARSDRQGRFEIASGGTLFLDEVGNLPYDMQSKILTSIQKKAITRVGSNQEISLDFRLISATNHNLHSLIEKNLFREDLYFRLKTIEIDIPPLRERTGDINIIADYFFSKFGVKYRKDPLKIENDVYILLNNYRWPGNIRELRNTIESTVIMCDNNTIKPADINLNYSHKSKDETLIPLDAIEKEAVRKALERANGNISGAAKLLDISRTTLYSKIKKHDL